MGLSPEDAAKKAMEEFDKMSMKEIWVEPWLLKVV